MGQKENIDTKENVKKDENSEQIEINVIDVAFYILLVIVVICLIPYMKAITDILMAGLKAESGRDIYFSVFALLFGIAVLISGFSFKNSVIKILGLGLTVLFALMPMSGYFGNNALFKSTLNDYEFVSLNIVRDMSCQGSSQFQQKLTEQLVSQYGDEEGLKIEVVVQPLDENATYKQKLQCMPTTTTMAYTLKYKDYYGEDREIVYINNDSYNKLLKVASYEIINEKIGEFLKSHQGQRNVSFELLALTNKNALSELDRNSLIEYGIQFEYPAHINLKNYNMDKKIVLEITMSDITKRDEAHDLIKQMTNQSIYPLNIIVHYGKYTEYYVQGKYYDISSRDDYISLLSKRV